MMKRIAALALVLALGLTMTGCQRPAQPPEEPSSAPGSSQTPQPAFTFTRENFPRLNGSTSMVPLGQAIASVLLGESRQEVEDLIQFDRTTASYRALMEGTCDLLLAAEPAPAVYEEKQAQGFDWRMEELAMDALIFVVNEDNPVDSLTAEQLRQIYTGQITNWSQVGGEDREIIPFQRNAEAGSQTLMEKLVMQGAEMMSAPTEQVILSMGELVDAVREYDGSPGAIGYTVYYYANDMNMADGLKILKVDGVAPEAESIRSRAYPFLNPYYVVMAAHQPDDSPAAVLFAWLLGQEGQALVESQGYVAVGGAQ